MKHIARELSVRIEESTKDQNDFEQLFSGFKKATMAFRNEYPIGAGIAEAAMGFTAIAIGSSMLNPVDYGTKVPELIGAALGGGIGGSLGGIAASTIGGIGVVMMGTGFGIPAIVITAIGASVGSSTGLIAGWFGGAIASHTASLAEVLFTNVSGLALVAFGCYLLFLAIKDLWRGGSEFILYLKELGVHEIQPEDDHE